MFTTKKQKIKRYLAQKTDGNKCAFDFLLSDYLDGTLKENLMSIGIEKAEIHIDWLDDFKCITIQGGYKEYYIASHIYPNEFSISFDLDEPEEDTTYPLESNEQLYSVISDTVTTL